MNKMLVFKKETHTHTHKALYLHTDPNQDITEQNKLLTVKKAHPWIYDTKMRYTRFKNQCKVRIFALMEGLKAEITGKDEQQSSTGAAAQWSNAAFLEVADHAAAHQKQPIWDREAKIMHFFNWVLNKIEFFSLRNREKDSAVKNWGGFRFSVGKYSTRGVWFSRSNQICIYQLRWLFFLSFFKKNKNKNKK